MVKDGVIQQYAIGGAVAAIFYIEPINTNDLDVFFHLETGGAKLEVLAPVYRYLAGLGYKAKGEAIEIEGRPVQFLPVFNPLVEEAVAQASKIEFKRTNTRVIKAEHLVAIMLQTGRLKDYARIQQFLDHKAVNRKKLVEVLARHGLMKNWEKCERDYLK
jgi:hypothetical protein